MADNGYRVLINLAMGAGLGIVVGAMEFGILAAIKGAPSSLDWIQAGAFFGLFGGIVIGFSAPIRRPLIRLGSATLLGAGLGMAFAGTFLMVADSLSFGGGSDTQRTDWSLFSRGSREGVVPGAIFGILVIGCMNALASHYRRAQ